MKDPLAASRLLGQTRRGDCFYVSLKTFTSSERQLGKNFTAFGAAFPANFF